MTDTPAKVSRAKKPPKNKYWIDLGERVFWTMVQGALAAISVEQFDFPVWSVIPIATALAFSKGIVARQLGNTDSASTVPNI